MKISLLTVFCMLVLLSGCAAVQTPKQVEATQGATLDLTIIRLVHEDKYALAYTYNEASLGSSFESNSAGQVKYCVMSNEPCSVGNNWAADHRIKFQLETTPTPEGVQYRLNFSDHEVESLQCRHRHPFSFVLHCSASVRPI